MDNAPYVERAVLAVLRAAPSVRVLVPAARVYGPQRPPNPTWPFIAYGQPNTAPFLASCMDGSTTNVAVHVYAETTGEGDDTVAGSDLAHAICGVIAALLDGASLPLDAPSPAVAHPTWTGTQVFQDGADANAFHGVCNFAIPVAS